jgi:hypothetical protein
LKRLTGAGDNAIIAASANVQKIYKLFLTAAGTTNLIFKAGATVLAGSLPVVAGSGLVLPFSTKPWFVIPANAIFIMNSSTAVAIGSACYYTVGA